MIDSNTALAPLSEQEQKKVYAPSEKWSDDFALKVAVQDFSSAEVYRTSNLDYRWSNCDQIYLAYGIQKYWEGTRIPRANIPVYTAFEQIESMLPRIMSAIFADYPNWFQVEARPGSVPDEARAVFSLMISQMENLGVHGIATVREVLRRCFKSGFIYGNGIAELCWLTKEEKRFYTYRQSRPERKTIKHPILGIPMIVPTGNQISTLRRINYTEKTNQPYLRQISIKDFYIDPNCPSPIVSDARYCAVRKLLTVDELDSMREIDGFKIPSKDDLIDLSKQRVAAQADVTKAQAEGFRQMWWQPAIDTTADPGGKRIEVIEYTTRDRKVWMANRKKIIFNEPNPYGFMNYYDVFYCDVLDRFYGLAITDVVEGEQRLQKGIIDSRIDELALSLNKPMIKRRGPVIPAYQLKSRPGQLIEVDNPKEDIVIAEVNNITQEAYIEVQASDLRVQKVTGGSDLAILGTPSSGGNSANRTATGVGAQMQATGGRVQYQVENAEDSVIEQILSDWHTMNQKFIDPEDLIRATGEQGKLIKIDPLVIMNSRVKFAMRASAKMQARQSLIQVWPLIMQSLTNPGFIQQLAQEGKAINWMEVQSMLLDATGYRNREALFVPMSQEQQQRMNQPPPEEMLRMQMQRERISGQKDIAEDKQLADMVRELIKSSMDKHGQESQSQDDLMHMIIDRAMQHHTQTTVAQLAPPAPKQPEEPSGA